MAKNEKEHKKILQLVLERAQKCGVKFNRKKCKFGVNKVKFLGHNFSDQGIEVDNEKVRAIKEMEKPKDVKAVERFLGMTTYVTKFINNLASHTVPLRELIKKDVKFEWNEEHDAAFEKIKAQLSESSILQYYDVNKECKISVDASSTGLGAVLLQDNLPIAYASKVFTVSQNSWAQIEKEMYAIVFGCERFRQYVIGKSVVVESDNKPLIPILKKPIPEVPLRLQKMRMRLQPFDIEVIYTPGKNLVIADTLSRAHLTESEDDVDPSLYILEVAVESAMSVKKRNEFELETEQDEELQTVIKLIRAGWPTEIKEVPNDAKAYHTYHTSLYEYKGLLFKKDCVVVPRKLRREVLNKLHYTHLGIEKTKNRAREIVYWPGMGKEIEEK